MNIHLAVIVRVSMDGGVAYAKDKTSDKLAAFSFGKITGYRGQSAKEIGLRPGAVVSVEYDLKNQIHAVSLESLKKEASIPREFPAGA